MLSEKQKPKLLDFFKGKAKTKRIVYYSTDKQRYTTAQVPQHMKILSKSDLDLDSNSLESKRSEISSIYTPSISSNNTGESLTNTGESVTSSGGESVSVANTDLVSNLSDIINSYTDDISETETDDTQSQKSNISSIRTIDTVQSSDSSASDSFFKN